MNEPTDVLLALYDILSDKITLKNIASRIERTVSNSSSNQQQYARHRILLHAYSNPGRLYTLEAHKWNWYNEKYSRKTPKH